jgi:hypothetical protein
MTITIKEEIASGLCPSPQSGPFGAMTVKKGRHGGLPLQRIADGEEIV